MIENVCFNRFRNFILQSFKEMSIFYRCLFNKSVRSAFTSPINKTNFIDFDIQSDIWNYIFSFH